jgi:hypothetical protein
MRIGDEVIKKKVLVRREKTEEDYERRNIDEISSSATYSPHHSNEHSPLLCLAWFNLVWLVSSLLHSLTWA